MGQYYKGVILKNDKKTIVGYVYAHDYNCGLKLTEHSYIDNPVVNVVLNYLKENGGGRVVWAGDYADAEPVKIPKEQAKEMWRNMVANNQIESSFAEFWAKNPNVFKRNERGEYDGDNLYTKAEKKPKLTSSANDTAIRFLINTDKMQFVDLWDVPCVNGQRVHPLPLLTAEGNGQGGGDYYGLSMNLVGTWARDNITVAEHNWSMYDSLKAKYIEIKPNFAERYGIVSQFNETVNLIKDAYADDGLDMDGYNDQIKEKFFELEKILKANIKGFKKEPATVKK